MEFSRQYLAELASKTGFIKDNLEKVLRLNSILRFINNDPYLKDRLLLKGGTAINFLFANLPRLSVDIDMDYIGDVDREKLLLEKKKIKEIIFRYMTADDYFLSMKSREYFALDSYVFSYINGAGNKDNIKIEINFMNRCHILLPIKYRIQREDILGVNEVYSLDKTELYASKINALISRSTPRDLYDVYKMIMDNAVNDYDFLKKCIIFYNMVGGSQNIDSIDYERIKKINYKNYNTTLKPVLQKNDGFDINEAIEMVIFFLEKILILENDEETFIKNFRNNKYKPELLFNDHIIVKRIKNHPMAIWRCKNLVRE